MTKAIIAYLVMTNLAKTSFEPLFDYINLTLIPLFKSLTERFVIKL